MCASQDDDTFSPVEICEWFGIPRTTLFRWEENGDIPSAERGERGKRIYRREHLESIYRIVRNKAEEDVDLAIRYKQGPYLTPESLERLYLAEYFGSGHPEEGLQQLKGLAQRTALSQRAIHLLVEDALKRPPGDVIRRNVWELLSTSDRSKDN